MFIIMETIIEIKEFINFKMDYSSNFIISIINFAASCFTAKIIG